MSEKLTIPENIDNCVRLCPGRLGKSEHYTSGYVLKEIIRKSIEEQCSGPIQTMERMAGSIMCGAVAPNYPASGRDMLVSQDIEAGLNAVDQEGMRMRLDVQAYEAEQRRIADS